jgi:hypothetical protein
MTMAGRPELALSWQLVPVCISPMTSLRRIVG